MGKIDLFRVFLRLLFMQALFNRRGLQNLGLVSALSQAGERLTGSDSDVLARHADYFNTNPNFAPLIVGAILRLEEEKLEGKPVDEKDIASFKKALASPLAAMGDQLFVGVLRPLSLTLGCLLAIYNFPIGLLAVFLLHSLTIVTCRFWGLRFGYTKGRELVEVISGSRFPRALRLIQGFGGIVSGVLVGVVFHRFLRERRLDGACRRGTGSDDAVPAEKTRYGVVGGHDPFFDLRRARGAFGRNRLRRTLV